MRTSAPPPCRSQAARCFVAGLCALTWGIGASADALGLARPNIVLFLVDDMGWQDTSVPFYDRLTVWNAIYPTPNMERLASCGMKFTSAYAASPVCSPTRVSLMTGKNPARSHVTSWIGHGQPRNAFLDSPQWAATGLQPGDGNVTLPSVLRENGYRTLHVGKAHFGGAATPGADPTQLGFDVNVGGSHIGQPRSYFAPWNPSVYPRLQQYVDGAYMTSALTSEANKLIDQAVADGVPFFLNLAHYAVHTPIVDQGDPQFLASFQAAGRPDPEDDYAAMIASMDASLGALLDNLEEEGAAENTLVVFTSDHGGLSNHTRHAGGACVVRTLAGKDMTIDYRKDGHNAPLKSGKGSAYEGGIRVPLLAAWAGQRADQPPVRADLPIAPGSTCDEPVISDDFFPTILQVAGVSNGAQYARDDRGRRRIDGVDLSPLLSGAGTFSRGDALYFHYPHQWYKDIGVGLGIEPFSAMRDGRYKLIYFYGDGCVDRQGSDPRLELYDLSVDLGEETNLAQSGDKEITRRLREKLVRYLEEVEAPLPIVRATGESAQP